MLWLVATTWNCCQISDLGLRLEVDFVFPLSQEEEQEEQEQEPDPLQKKKVWSKRTFGPKNN